MRLVFTPLFKHQLSLFSEIIRKKFYKQTRFLINDLRHPSLRAKKYDESQNIWQARLDRDIRFYFSIEADAYIFHKIKKHPK